MKGIIQAFLLIYCSFFHCILYPAICFTPDMHKSLLTVVIMVKNEVEVIIPTLEPFIKAGINTFLVYDTGSTDGTQNKIVTYFQEKNLEHAYVFEEPFVDFATSRNRALDLAEDLFPNSTFFLMLDAEWYMTNVEGLIDFCKIHENTIAPDSNGGCYLIRLVTAQDGIDNVSPRLIRRGKNVRYSGVVHESIKEIPSGRVDGSVYFTYLPKETGQKKSKKRLKRDYQLLKNDLDNNPTNLRTLFYLAQTCQFLDRWDEAIYYYQQRAAQGYISEERYLALYRIGCAIDHLLYVSAKNNEPCDYQWHDALFYYLEAHAMLPHRAEPLVRIALHYLQNKQHAIAYLFAHRAVNLPYPINDKLFIERDLYDFLRYDILGQCALYVGEYKEGKNAVIQALNHSPEMDHLYHNLSVYSQYV